MPLFFSPPREAHTTLSCPACGSNLDIRRTCHEAYMHCPACSKDWPLEGFIPSMDDAMEAFLEQMYADRI